jgi:F0F1-type ATP synthase membrane subunit b/b'
MEVADLAVNAAGKILRKEISADDQRELIEKTLSEDAR